MYMCDKEKEYDNAIDAVEKRLLDKLKPEEIYQLYGIHKQCLVGDCKEPKPSPFADQNKRNAWVAWLKCTGMTQNQCMSKYINLVKAHLKAHPAVSVVKTNNKYGTKYITKCFDKLVTKEIKKDLN